MKLYGPIVQPLQCQVKDVIVALMGGCELHQVDPVTKRSVKLTLSNVKDDQKFIPITPEMTYKVGADIKTKTTTGVKIEPAVVMQTATPVSVSNTTENNTERAVTETTENRPMSKKELKRLRREQQAAAEASKQPSIDNTNDDSSSESSENEQQPPIPETTEATDVD